VMEGSNRGTLWIRGALKRRRKLFPTAKIADSQCEDEYYKLSLTSQVSNEDFRQGYCMTGVVERSGRKYAPYAVTHMAFVKRREDVEEDDKLEAIEKNSDSDSFADQYWPRKLQNARDWKRFAAGGQRLAGESGRRLWDNVPKMMDAAADRLAGLGRSAWASLWH